MHVHVTAGIAWLSHTASASTHCQALSSTNGTANSFRATRGAIRNAASVGNLVPITVWVKSATISTPHPASPAMLVSLTEPTCRTPINTDRPRLARLLTAVLETMTCKGHYMF
eukprot:365480-Chlamydomonas_euryale.AAC.11